MTVFSQANIKHLTWMSTAGYPQERWAVMRGDAEIGSVRESYNTKYTAILNYDFTGSFKNKQFATFNAAVRWIERQTKNIHSWDELNTLLKDGAL